MPYLLDTNVWVNLLRGRDAGLMARVHSAQPPSDIHLCAPVKAELLYGAYHSTRVQQNLTLLRGILTTYSSLPFDDRAAERYGPVRADLEAKGTPIGAIDYLIAAIALANDLTLITHDTGEFSRIPGLRIEDWQTP